MKTKEISKKISELAFLLIFLYFTVFPNEASEPAYEAIVFCAKSLVPHIFIFIFLSKAVISSALFRRISEYTGIYTSSLILGTLCGCPNGAKNAKTLFDSGVITKKQAEYLCTFTNNPSASFVLGFVGISLFGDVKIGIFLLFCEIFSAAATKIIMKRIMFGREKAKKAELPVLKKPSFSEMISDSAMTLINICVSVMFFRVTGSAISRFIKEESFFSKAFNVILEFSSGCKIASSSEIFALPLCGFAIGFSGLSVFLQTKSIVKNSFSLKPYMAAKIFQGALCSLLCLIFG